MKKIAAPLMRTHFTAFCTAFAAVSLSACGSTTESPPPDGGGSDVTSVSDVPASMDTGMADTPPPPPPPPPLDVTTFNPDGGSAEPITAPMESWTWIPFPDSACGNGSPAGIGVNLTNRSRRVLIYMQGGGGCWDPVTCFTLRAAAHLDENYTSATFTTEISGVGQALIFNRASAQNPFRDASFVYVPYCTGDIHGGNSLHDYDVNGRTRTVYHVGFRNMTSFLRRLVPTFQGSDRVWISGSSAGGYGAALNWDQTQRAFGDSVRVDALDDSGPPIAVPSGRWREIRDAWNLQLPAECPTCRDNITNITDFYLRRFGLPHRFGLLSYTRDGTIAGYFTISADRFQESLNDVAATLDMNPGARYYFVNGTQHTMIGGISSITSNGTRLSTWIQQFATDDAAWASVRPPAP